MSTAVSPARLRLPLAPPFVELGDEAIVCVCVGLVGEKKIKERGFVGRGQFGLVGDRKVVNQNPIRSLAG